MELFEYQGYFHYVIFLTIYLTLLAFPGGKSSFKTKRFSFFILLTGVLSLGMHDSAHLFQPAMMMKERWTPTIVVPIILAFSSLFTLPFSYRPKTNDFRFGGRSLEVWLALIFCFLLFFTRREVGYYLELATQWKLGNSFIHVFSKWVLAAGAALALFFGGRSLYGRQKKYFGWLGLTGFVAIIWFSAGWGNILANYRSQELATRSAQINFMVRILEGRIDKTLIFVGNDAEPLQNGLLTATLLNKGNVGSMLAQHIRLPDEEGFEAAKKPNYQFLIASDSIPNEVLKKGGEKVKISFLKMESLHEISLYKIKKGAAFP